MKQLLSIAVLLSAFLSTSAHAFFFFIPGAAISAISDAVTGSEGENCVGPNAVVVGAINLGGTLMTVKSLSGTSIRCTNPQLPIRALLVPSTSVAASAHSQPNATTAADREAATKQQAEFARLEIEAVSKAKAEAEMAAEVQAKAASDAKARADAEATVRPTTVASPSPEVLQVVKLTQYEMGATQRMRDLNALYKEGLITQREFDSKKKEVLKSM